MEASAVSGSIQLPHEEARRLANPAADLTAERAATLPAIFRKYRSVVDEGLFARLSPGDSQIYDILRYSMGWAAVEGHAEAATTGKAMRPALCLFACEANGGEVRRALPAALSLELVHRFSLIHDDIQDHDETRHNRPTVWKLWGEPTALLAGNALRAVAALCLRQLVDEGVSHARATAVSRLLTQASLEMIEGQYLDIAYEGRRNVGLDDYLDMITKKTGALIRCSVATGAMVAGRETGNVKAFEECGRSLGLLFQVRDDALGMWGDEEITGKPVGADIRRKKNTLPIVYAMSVAGPRDSSLLAETYRKPAIGDDDVTLVLDIADGVGAREFVAEFAAQHCDAALEALARVELEPMLRDEIEELAQFLLMREH